MSRTSKQCLREKNIFRHHLDEIQEFLNPQPIDLQIEAFISETEEYERMYAQDVEDGLFDDWMREDWEENYDADDWADNIYDFDDYEMDDAIEALGGIPLVFSVGTYYKFKKKTYLCVRVNGMRHLVDVLNGEEFKDFKNKEFTKVG